MAVAQPSCAHKSHESYEARENNTLQPIVNRTPPPAICICPTVLVVHSPAPLMRMDAVWLSAMATESMAEQ